jgi:hypothetical protein
MGFPVPFINMAHMLFNDAAARVSVNGKSTLAFPILQGVRQGCPLAPYLFLIIGEILSHNIKREAQRGCISGIDLPGAEEQQIIAQFANDTSLSIRGEEASVLATRDILQRYYDASGLINKGKSSAYYSQPQGNPRPP